jgi:hypothetical protein
MTRAYLSQCRGSDWKRVGPGGRSIWKGFEMCKAAELVERLSAAERSSLRLIGAGLLRRPIPGRHADKLIGLGLAELIFGEPGLTGGGHRALGLIGA